MSLQACKRIAELKAALARTVHEETLYSDRRARGWVNDAVVETALYTVHRVWIVAVLSHKHWTISKRRFLWKERAERYFEKLTKEYDLKESER